MDWIIAALRGLLGIGVLMGIAYALSASRREINWRIVVSGLGLQFVREQCSKNKFKLDFEKTSLGTKILITEGSSFLHEFVWNTC